MELMFLVYAVENLTYGGSFFISVAGGILTFLLVILTLKGSVHVYNQLQTPKVKVVETSLKPKENLRKGHKFILSEDVGGLKKGLSYNVSAVYSALNDLQVEEHGSCVDFKLDAVEEQLRKQSYREEVVQPVKISLPKLPIKTLATLIVVSLCLHTLLPSRQTAIYMASAYAIQQVVTADKTKELADKGYNALSSQLDKWSKEVPEVADMLVDAGLATVKDKVVESK